MRSKETPSVSSTMPICPDVNNSSRADQPNVIIDNDEDMVLTDSDNYTVEGKYEDSN